MYFSEEEVSELFKALAEKFSGAEMLIETIPYSLVKQSQSSNLIENNTISRPTSHGALTMEKRLRN